MFILDTAQNHIMYVVSWEFNSKQYPALEGFKKKSSKESRQFHVGLELQGKKIYGEDKDDDIRDCTLLYMCWYIVALEGKNSQISFSRSSPVRRRVQFKGPRLPPPTHTSSDCMDTSVKSREVRVCVPLEY